eukprot:2237797-Alexandrium_andersonii.AAC.1
MPVVITRLLVAPIRSRFQSLCRPTSAAAPAWRGCGCRPDMVVARWQSAAMFTAVWPIRSLIRCPTFRDPIVAGLIFVIVLP